VRPMPADGRSIVGWLPGADGLYAAVTHSGATLAAHLSQLIAAELVSGAPAAALAPFRPDRFAAAGGSVHTPGSLCPAGYSARRAEAVRALAAHPAGPSAPAAATTRPARARTASCHAA
jgi:hypothetical protein